MVSSQESPGLQEDPQFLDEHRRQVVKRPQDVAEVCGAVVMLEEVLAPNPGVYWRHLIQLAINRVHISMTTHGIQFRRIS